MPATAAVGTGGGLTSSKTTALVYRVLDLLRNHIRPSSDDSQPRIRDKAERDQPEGPVPVITSPSMFSMFTGRAPLGLPLGFLDIRENITHRTGEGTYVRNFCPP